jgi:hypothetical protein
VAYSLADFPDLVVRKDEKEEKVDELTCSREKLESACEAEARLIRGAMEELARRDDGREFTDHHRQALAEATGPAFSSMSLEELGEALVAGVQHLSAPALIYETRFRDGTYTQLIYNALQPLTES